REDIRRAARYMVSTNAGELAFAIGAGVVGIDEPLSPLQLLWINLVGDTFPALGLALEPADDDALSRPPPSPDEPLFHAGSSRRLVAEAAALAAGGAVAWAGGVRRGTRAAGSAAAVAFMLAQVVQAWRVRAHPERLPGRGLVAALGVSTAL